MFAFKKSRFFKRRVKRRVKRYQMIFNPASTQKLNIDKLEKSLL